MGHVDVTSESGPMPARSPEPPTQTGSAGLVDALRGLAAELERWSGAPVVVGADPAGDPPAERLQLETVRLVVPPFPSDRDISRVDAHVLVESHGPDPAVAADRLAAVLLRTLAAGDRELVAGEPGPELWHALGRPSRPAFLLRVPLFLAREPQQPSRVREPLHVRGGPLRQVHGRVLAPDGTPLAGARVRLHPSGPPVVSGHDGRWSLSLPGSDVVLDVEARGLRVSHALPGDADPAAVDVVVAGLGSLTSHPTTH